MPNKNDRKNLLFSATFSKEIKNTAYYALKSDYLLATTNIEDYVINDNINQEFHYVENSDKPNFLHETLQKIKGNTIIFMETKKSVDELSFLMRKGKYNCASIHGDKSQHERNFAVDNFKLGKIPILIATDVIGRGIDFPNVSYIFNYDMPKNVDDYIHRIGRTGRCGNEGNSISLINDSSQPIINDLYKLLKKQNKVIPECISNLYNKNKGYSFKGNGNRKYY